LTAVLAASIARFIASLALTLRELLHPIPHAFQLGQRFLNVTLVAGALTRLALLLQPGLRLLELIA
jgi:hypothetical protein